MMEFLCYPRCSTCKKAQQFLDVHGITYRYRDIKEQNPTLDEVRQIYKNSGLPLKKLFNTSGNVYKELNLKDKLQNMSEEEQLTLLASDGMLLKRPILISDKRTLIGYREEEYQSLL